MTFILYWITLCNAAYFSITSDDSKLASLQLVKPKFGDQKKLVYRLGTEGEYIHIVIFSNCIISLNGEPLMTYKYEDHSFEIYTGFSTSAGIKITDPENKFYYRNLS